MNQVTHNHGQRWLPTPGNIIFTIIAIICTLGIQQLWAMSTNTNVSTLAYQCYLTDSSGTALNGSYQLSFKVYDAPTGGSLLWGPETHNGVTITQGLCNLRLGSMTTGGFPYQEGFLEITVNGELLTPREMLAPQTGVVTTTSDNMLLQNKNKEPLTGTTTVINFPEPFGNIPTVIAVGDTLGGQNVTVRDVYPTQFTVDVPNTDGNLTINWIAVGERLSSPIVGGLITNLQGHTGNPYVIGVCNTGLSPYTDRTTMITGFSDSAYAGMECIRTANDDKHNSQSNMFEFDLLQPAEIAVCIDQRTTINPDWLAMFNATGETVSVSDSYMSHCNLYRCNSQPGHIVMSGSQYGNGYGNQSNYFVMVRPINSGNKLCTAGSQTVMPPPPTSPLSIPTSITRKKTESHSQTSFYPISGVGLLLLGWLGTRFKLNQTSLTSISCRNDIAMAEVTQ